jgi:hypothetical protein
MKTGKVSDYGVNENFLGAAGKKIFDQMEHDDFYFLNFPSDEVRVVGHKTYLLIRALGLEIARLENKISDIEEKLGNISNEDIRNIQLR